MTQVETSVLHLPGLGGSGEGHWQSIWAKKLPGHSVVQQQDWDTPDNSTWMEAFSNQYVSPADQTVIVAHSLGCALAVHWVLRRQNAARLPRFLMLVAAADVDDRERTPHSVRSFAPMPIQKLPCPSVVVASKDDPYVSFERAQYFAACWGSSFLSVGDGGHLNTDSDLGDWAFGRQILDQAIHAGLTKPE